MDIGTGREILRLQLEWGIDVDLDDVPHDRFAESAAELAHRMSVRQETGQPGIQSHDTEEEAAMRGVWQATTDDVRTADPKRSPATGYPGSSRPTSQRPSPVPSGPLAAADLADVDSIEALARVIDGFDGCVLRGTATHSVLPHGPVGARLMVIGDAPDEDEDRSGLPFSGLAGSLLDRMLASIGLKREQLVLASAVPWRPPGGRAPSPAEVAACLPLLLRSIAVYRPERLLLCGGLATRMVLGAASSDATAGMSVNPARLRGAWRTTTWDPEWGAQRAALAIRHPLQLRASAAARREIWGDLLLLAVTLDGARNAGNVIME